MSSLQQIRELAAQHFGREVDAIDVDTPVADLGVDSLGFLEFLFELEDKLSMSIPQDAVQHVRTMRELAEAIDALKASKTDSIS